MKVAEPGGIEQNHSLKTFHSNIEKIANNFSEGFLNTQPFFFQSLQEY